MILSGADGGQERAKMDGEYWPRCYYYKLHTRTHTLSLKAGAVVCIQWCYSDIQRLHDFRSTGHFLFFGGKSSSVNPRVGCDGGEKSQRTTRKLKNNNNNKKTLSGTDNHVQSHLTIVHPPSSACPGLRTPSCCPNLIG